MNILTYHSFYLIGIKGVAMTGLAQCLSDAGKKVAGCDVADDFVTASLLNKLNIQIDDDFHHDIPEATQCVIYTAAHNGAQNPAVQRAHESGTAILTYAEAMASLFNQKQGIAVCGVGGKSTVSAMLVWIFNQLATQGIVELPSFMVGVGDIPGLHKTGGWNDRSPYFIAEADEYVSDPTVVQTGKLLEPKFWYLHPQVAVCTNLKFDHPDVFKNFEQTKQAFNKFFDHVPADGVIIANGDDQQLMDLLKNHTDKKVLTYGESDKNDLFFSNFSSEKGRTTATIHVGTKSARLELQVPARFNTYNALAALAVTHELDLPLEVCCQALASFRSTKRRFELIGIKRTITYYDDYAHHPHEVAASIAGLKEWYPQAHKVVAFQPHTYSRTKQLFDEFVAALATTNEVVLTDIFASAREKTDATISSDDLATAIAQKYPQITVTNVKTNHGLAEYIQTKVPPHSVVLTMGAGDIYQVHELIQ